MQEALMPLNSDIRMAVGQQLKEAAQWFRMSQTSAFTPIFHTWMN